MSSDIILTDIQRDDLIQLLVLYLPRSNLMALMNDVLGGDAIRQLANELGTVESLAKGIVTTLIQSKKVAAAVSHLRQGGGFSRLQLGLNHILNGESFGSASALQGFVNEYEPFLSSEDLLQIYPLITRRICAVGLGKPFNRLVGSGFLIAPDLVMTNFHVLKDVLLIEEETRAVKQHQDIGREIYFYFDYISGPPPKVPPPKVLPNGVPANDALTNSIAVSAAEEWLVHARTFLPFDGTKQCSAVVDTEYDYAVIRLSVPIGERPLRNSGGPIRGWLNLQDDIDVLTRAQRILIFQHPETGPQQFDVGDFVQLDATKTRVWYSVSAANGSSGGAAVNKQGSLFALHNARVDEDVCVVNGKRVNQGVRIDYIYKDLESVPGFAHGAAPQSGIDSFWSLKDDPADPQPVIGRADFRKQVAKMQQGGEGTPRVLSVTGPAGSGKKFSVDLLRRIIGPQIPVVMFAERELQYCSPRLFTQVLVQELGLSSLMMPEQLSTEAFPRWLRLDLPQWLQGRLAENQQGNATTYPRWVVINTVTPDNRRLLWAEHLRDYLVALLGVNERGQPGIPLPHLRWLFLSETTDTLLLGNVLRYDDDLSDFSRETEEFAECLKLACQTLDKTVLDEATSKFVAKAVLDSSVAAPRRQVLANLVCQYLNSNN